MRFRRLVIVLLLAALVAACTKVYTSPSSTTPAAAAPARAATIEFRVFGSGLLLPVTIRHIDPVNGLTIVTVAPPYFASVTSTDPSDFVYLEASGTGFSTATLQVQIFANGKLFREGSSTGSVLFASASGTVRP